jgi:signal transduction histidine kinase
MRRLYLQIYLAFLAIVVLGLVVAALAWRLRGAAGHDVALLRSLSTVAGDMLPAPGRPPGETQASLQRLSRRLALSVALHAPDGTLIARAGGTLPAPRASWNESHWVGTGSGPGVALHLEDGRWLIAGRRHRAIHALGGLAALGVVALVIAAGAYPVARRIASRLERLQQRVDALGAGDFKSRVEVEGRDEVAELARSFNRAAERIERLVAAQRNVLAGASHELRSPLARIRVAAELLAEGAPPDLAQGLARDVAELDELVAELLVASRLEAATGAPRREEVDLLALTAEECARVSAEAEGRPVLVSGDPRLLRRMVRNLLDNARRYGGGSAVEARVEGDAAGAVLRVADRGPGVPEAERERIFEPFYRAAGWREGPEGGVGLGLALVRQIARHHGGDARYVPREGGGSCFEVRLPVTAPS